MDYIRWVYRLDFNIPRYIIRRELDLSKAKIEWSLRTKNFEEKIRLRGENSLVNKCWKEKEERDRKDLYSLEREKYYNNSGWEIKAIEDLRDKDINMTQELKEKEKDIQRQLDDIGIRNAKYNKKYKKIGVVIGKPRYLRNEDLDKVSDADEVRALIKLRCGNMKESNKYWMKNNNK